MTAERLAEIRERIEADGPADMRCAWCDDEMPETGVRQCLSGDCQRDPGDVCQQDRGELFDELERAQITASDFSNAIAYVGLRLGRLPTEHVAGAAERLLATLATMTADRNALAGAIADATFAAGIYNMNAAVTVPHLLLLLKDMTALLAIVTTERDDARAQLAQLEGMWRRERERS